MTQADLKHWCEVNNCFVYEEINKADGDYYLMRSFDNKKLMAMIFPPKSGMYRAATVCHVCNQLGIEVPDYGKPMQESVNEAKANAPKDWRNTKKS